jgi:hypothetical protein
MIWRSQRGSRWISGERVFVDRDIWQHPGAIESHCASVDDSRLGPEDHNTDNSDSDTDDATRLELQSQDLDLPGFNPKSSISRLVHSGLE